MRWMLAALASSGPTAHAPQGVCFLHRMQAMTKRVVTSEEATPLDTQPTKPCSDCPWARKAVAGWLGPHSAETWLQIAHGEGRIDCHVFTGPQCAGAAIYRTNMCKYPRDRNLLRLPADKRRVFTKPTEFLAHHSGKKLCPHGHELHVPCIVIKG